MTVKPTRGVLRRVLRMMSLLLALVGSPPALAQSTVGYLNRSLPDRFRARAETLVRALRPDDAEAAVSNLKTLNAADDLIESMPLVLRIATDCDRCMTIIARAEPTSLVPELILNAGEPVLFTDFSYGLWGSPAWPAIVFDGDGSAGIMVIRRGEHWVVDACSDCNEWAGVKRPEPVPAPPEPPPPLKPKDFDDFRRSLGLDAQ